MQEEFIAYANSEGLDEHMHLHTLSRAFATRKQIFSLTLSTGENIFIHFKKFLLKNSSCCVSNKLGMDHCLYGGTHETQCKPQ